METKVVTTEPGGNDWNQGGNDDGIKAAGIGTKAAMTGTKAADWNRQRVAAMTGTKAAGIEPRRQRLNQGGLNQGGWDWNQGGNDWNQRLGLEPRRRRTRRQ